jgi:signal transduction histidine kinase
MRLSVVVALLALAAALAVSSVAGWSMVRDARAAAAAEVNAALGTASLALRSDAQQALEALEPMPAVAAAKLYRAGGEVVAQYQRPAMAVPMQSLAARLAPPEVACGSVTLADRSPATLCIESSAATIAPRVRSAVMLIAVSSIAALIAGALAGHAVARAQSAPLRRMAEVMDRAAREHAYSLRVEKGSGELARIAESANELLAQMQERDVTIRRRTTELEAANKDLESFAYSVSHDLRAPLGSIDGFSQALELDHSDKLDDEGREYLSWIRQAARQMRDLIDGLLQMSRLARAELQREPVDLTSIARSVADSLQQSNPDRTVRFEIRDGVRTVGDERLLRAVLENLMTNAWKFTRNRPEAKIEFGMAGNAYYVRDNGAGFDPSHASKMFRPFQRLHSTREFEGTGIGLATVQKIVERHGGKAWAEGEVEKGATIYFTTA